MSIQYKDTLTERRQTNNEQNRIKNELFKKAFITYTTAGFPDMKKTKEIILAQEEAGIDVIELGIPFSDPVADGPVIQDASVKAINAGANLEKVFVLMKELRDEKCEVPILFMMYYNTAYHYGLDAFIKKCAECGVDGLIIPDLPYEEQDEILAIIDKTENAPVFIELVSPVSRGRIAKIVKRSRGFVYCVSQMGVTGGDAHDFHKNLHDYLAEVKRQSDVPVMMGFGIKTAADVKPFEDVIDGAIVGSRFIKLLEESNFSTEAVKDYIKKFKEEM